jgi:hypothetical protein
VVQLALLPFLDLAINFTLTVISRISSAQLNHSKPIFQSLSPIRFAHTATRATLALPSDDLQRCVAAQCDPCDHQL